MSFEEFKRVGNLKPLNLGEKFQILKQLKARIDNFTPDSITADSEDAANQLICLCEELLRCSIPPNLNLLRACKVDTEALLSKLDSIYQGEMTIIAIDSGLDDGIQIQIERLILSKLKEGICQEYKIACLTKLAAILSHSEKPGRKQEAEDFLKVRECFFDEIGDEEGKSFVHSQFEHLPSQFEDYDVKPFNSKDEDIVHIICPCCGQKRPCKPFSEIAQIGIISVPGRIPYQGILFCMKCNSLRCGMNASWMRFAGREAELATLKQKGMIPENAEIYSAKCTNTGCDGDLYALTADILRKIGESHAQ